MATDAVELEAAGIRFPAYYRETPLRDGRGAILLLHGQRSGPDDAGLIRRLRLGLPERGWSTLSLALPGPEAGPRVWLPEADARLAAGVAWIKGKNVQRIVALGQDTGAWVVLDYLRRQPDAAVAAAVLVEAAAMGMAGEAPFAADDLARITIPLLELSNGGNRGGAAEDAAKRRTALKANPGYSQIVLQDADQTWQDSLEFMLNRIHAWLTRKLGKPAGNDPKE